MVRLASTLELLGEAAIALGARATLLLAGRILDCARTVRFVRRALDGGLDRAVLLEPPGEDEDCEVVLRRGWMAALARAATG